MHCYPQTALNQSCRTLCGRARWGTVVDRAFGKSSPSVPPWHYSNSVQWPGKKRTTRDQNREMTSIIPWWRLSGALFCPCLDHLLSRVTESFLRLSSQWSRRDWESIRTSPSIDDLCCLQYAPCHDSGWSSISLLSIGYSLSLPALRFDPEWPVGCPKEAPSLWSSQYEQAAQDGPWFAGYYMYQNLVEQHSRRLGQSSSCRFNHQAW